MNQQYTLSLLLCLIHAAEMYNSDGELQDNLTIYFETEDTCFCYGHCGCAVCNTVLPKFKPNPLSSINLANCRFVLLFQCGANNTVCPTPPTFHKDDKFINWEKGLAWLNEVTNFLKSHFGKFVLASWFILLLLFLGALKVVHMIITGEIDYPAVSEPTLMALQMVKNVVTKIVNEWCPKLRDCVCGYGQRRCLKLCACCARLTTGKTEFTETATNMSKLERGWRRPRKCNGMCAGARKARRNHRTQMRINKRKGVNIDRETPWFSKPYTCSCIIRYTLSIYAHNFMIIFHSFLQRHYAIA